VVICLERGADLPMAQLMPLPLTVSCFSKIQTGFTFLVPAHLGSPGKGSLNGCVCVCLYFFLGQLLAELKLLRATTTFLPSKNIYVPVCLWTPGNRLMIVL